MVLNFNTIKPNKFGLSKLLLFGTQNKNIDSSELKAFSFDNLNVTKLIKCLFDGVENIVGKGENGDYQHFPFFHNVFNRLLPQGLLKFGLRGNRLNHSLMTESFNGDQSALDGTKHVETFFLAVSFNFGCWVKRMVYVEQTNRVNYLLEKQLDFREERENRVDTLNDEDIKGESNTFVSAYTLYWHLQQYCSHP